MKPLSVKKQDKKAFVNNPYDERKMGGKGELTGEGEMREQQLKRIKKMQQEFPGTSLKKLTYFERGKMNFEQE